MDPDAPGTEPVDPGGMSGGGGPVPGREDGAGGAPAGIEVPVDRGIDPVTGVALFGGGVVAALLVLLLVRLFLGRMRRSTPALPVDAAPPIEAGEVARIAASPEGIDLAPAVGPDAETAAPVSTGERVPGASVRELPVARPQEIPPPEESLVARFRTALGRSRAALAERFDQLFGRSTIDASVIDELEEVLLAADVGVPTTERLLAPLRESFRRGEARPEEMRAALRESIRTLLSGRDTKLNETMGDGPLVILVVGVNGSGKTTTIGKLAARHVRAGRRVLVVAGDTHRAAAIEQLGIWAERAGADIVANEQGSDPGAVVFDGLSSAKARGHDVVIIDTAGRLQTMKPLMEQLSKIRRVIAKVVPDGPHETLLVLDGTMGQNGLSQARLFHEATPLTGVAVTKLDGTAKGGMILTIAAELGLPVKLVGIGEKVEDLKDFEAAAFVEVLA